MKKLEVTARARWPRVIGLLALLVSPWLQAAPDGEELYRHHCAACHGENGRGGVGVPLALRSFQSGVDDRFLRETIRRGRPGRVMPAFPTLSDAQVNAVITYLRRWSEEEPPVFSTARISGDPKRGETLFAGHCASCHGQHGEGGKGTGVTFSRRRSLPIIAPALNNSGFLAAASDALIRNAMVLGREGTPMTSSLVDGLSEEDIDDVVSYIRSFESGEASVPDTRSEPATIRVRSPYGLEETVENLKQAITDQNFTLIREEPLDHGLVPDGEERSDAVVLHFCNFRFLYEALSVDPRVGVFLPCRITVVEREGSVEVMSVNPLPLSRLFNNAELNKACKEMHGIYSTIIEDATL